MPAVPFFLWQAFSYTTLEKSNLFMERGKNGTERMATLYEAINHAVKRGYTELFKFVLIGLTTEAEEKYYSRRDIKIINFFLLKGYSDPREKAVLYLIETSDRKKGFLVEAHGSYANDKLSSFIREVEDWSI